MFWCLREHIDFFLSEVDGRLSSSKIEILSLLMGEDVLSGELRFFHTLIFS